MQTIFNQETLPVSGPVIFLAGPTPREAHVMSWRPDALKILAAAGFEGAVVIPENRGFSEAADFDHGSQVAWERQCLKRADVVLFWIPRDLAEMPGFTTNIEFGFVSERDQPFVLGYPVDAPKMKYLDWVAREKNAPVRYTLAETIAATLQRLPHSTPKTARPFTPGA